MGYFGIGVENLKTPSNLGTLWRSAYCLGASYIFTIGERYKHQRSDTCKAFRHIPLFQFADALDFFTAIPRGASLVGVELTEYAEPLELFRHPKQAVYVLGPEDGNLSDVIIGECAHVVRFRSDYCLNVAVAGSVVMYDRQTKGA